MISQRAKAWLPESAILDPRGVAAIDTVLEAWSGEWLASETGMSLASWSAWVGPLPRDRMDPSPGLALCSSPEGRLQLASALLGREVTERKLRTEADRAVIERLVDSALGALGSKLDALLGTSASQPDDNHYAIVVGLADGADMLTIVVSCDRLTAFAKGRVAEQRLGAPVQPRKHSLAGQQVCLGAVLGRTRLSLAEVETLQKGDVIILDDSADSLLDITINGRPAATRVAALGGTGSRHFLTFEKAPVQW